MELEPEATPDRQPDVVTEELVRVHFPVSAKHRARVSQQPIAGIDPDERPGRGPDLHAAADVQRKGRTA